MTSNILLVSIIKDVLNGKRIKGASIGENMILLDVERLNTRYHARAAEGVGIRLQAEPVALSVPGATFDRAASGCRKEGSRPSRQEDWGITSQNFLKFCGHINFLHCDARLVEVNLHT